MTAILFFVGVTSFGFSSLLEDTTTCLLLDNNSEEESRVGVGVIRLIDSVGDAVVITLSVRLVVVILLAAVDDLEKLIREPLGRTRTRTLGTLWMLFNRDRTWLRTTELNSLTGWRVWEEVKGENLDVSTCGGMVGVDKVELNVDGMLGEKEVLRTGAGRLSSTPSL